MHSKAMVQKHFEIFFLKKEGTQNLQSVGMHLRGREVRKCSCLGGIETLCITHCETSGEKGILLTINVIVGLGIIEIYTKSALNR